MQQGSPWLALIALADQQAPSLEAVNQTLQARFPDSDRLMEASHSDRGATFRVGTANGNYTLVTHPIPWDRLEGPCATAWYWPEAESALRNHAAHLFVTLLDEANKPIETAICLTKVVTAIAESCDAVGLVWGPSGQVHRPQDFAELAATTTQDDLPLHLWVDFRVTQWDNPDELALFTTGLEALGHREFETPRFYGEAQQLAGDVYNVAHYVLESGATLKDGEAVGLPHGGQVNVRLGPSMLDAEQEVLQLEFE